MSPEEYQEQAYLLSKQMNRCKYTGDRERIQTKIDALEIKYDFSRRSIGRPEQKLQQYGVI